MNHFSFLSNEYNRDKWVIQQLSKINNGESILDVGAGEKKYKVFCKHLKYMSQDFGQYEGFGDGIGLQMGKWNSKDVDIISDILRIPIKDSLYDNVLCTEVLKHVPYPELVISEIARILRNNGKLILTAPFASQTHFSPYFYSTGFGINWYKQNLGVNNFKIISIKANGNFFDYINQELCRLPLVLKRYSSLGILSYLLYLIIIPVVMICWLISKFSTGSNEQLCFGYHVIAKKV